MAENKKRNYHVTGSSFVLENIVDKIKKGAYTPHKIPRQELLLDILTQPDDTTCGPTCLHALYRFYGDKIELSQVIEEVHAFEGGGTLAVWLACHALKRGYEATIYTYNLQMFDPIWFEDETVQILEKLNKQLVVKQEPTLALATNAYKEFLGLGGKLAFEDLTKELLCFFLTKEIPILTGLNSNFLYRSEREIWTTNQSDDIRGEPAGHFVVLSGYDHKDNNVFIKDPYDINPYHSKSYQVSIERVINSILLGIVTFDANFLIITPKV